MFEEYTLQWLKRMPMFMWTKRYWHHANIATIKPCPDVTRVLDCCRAHKKHLYHWWGVSQVDLLAPSLLNQDNVPLVCFVWISHLQSEAIKKSVTQIDGLVKANHFNLSPTAFLSLR